MTFLDPTLVETLLNTAEGNVLDFKSAQYTFEGDDAARAELVKDILAFANAWKAADAYIVIGVEDGLGKRARVTGVAKHLDDHSLQQLMAAKTNVPIAFEYLPTTVDGLPVGIIRIAKEQPRPVFLKKAFAWLKANTVYMRRGSSTVEADPDEVARMGQARVTVAPSPELTVHLGDDKKREIGGSPVTVTSRVIEPRRRSKLQEALGIDRPIVQPRMAFQPDPEKVAEYRRERGLLRRLAFAVNNKGTVTLSDVRIVAKVPKVHDLLLRDGPPERPRSSMDRVLTSIGNRYMSTTPVRENGDSFELTCRITKVQPSATAWAEPFWIGSMRNRTVPFAVTVYADNLPKPVEAAIDVSVTIVKAWDVDADDEDEEDDE